MNSGHRIGPIGAKFTLIEFGDFQCPACAAYQRVLVTMRARHPTDFAVVYHQFPLSYHSLAYPLARASECAAQQDRFAAMHDVLFREQERLGVTPMADFARHAGIPDINQFMRCARHTTPVPAIERDKADGRHLGLPGTPTVIVNGVMHTTDLDVRALEALLKEAQR